MVSTTYSLATCDPNQIETTYIARMECGNRRQTVGMQLIR